MKPLPKPFGWAATVVALITGLGTVLQFPFVHALVTGNPKAAAVLSTVTVIVAALAHSLPGDGGDGSIPVN